MKKPIQYWKDRLAEVEQALAPWESAIKVGPMFCGYFPVTITDPVTGSAEDYVVVAHSESLAVLQARKFLPQEIKRLYKRRVEARRHVFNPELCA